MESSVCPRCGESAENASGDCRLLHSDLCGHQICSHCVESCLNSSSAGPEKNNFGSASSSVGVPTTRGRPLSAKGNSTIGIDSHNSVSGNDNEQRFPCPMCSVMTTRSSWVGRADEDSRLELERLVRSKVFSVLNRGKDRFENTPSYNDYLEMREEHVYEMVFGMDEAKKRDINAKLDETEIENQQEIVENTKKAETLDRLRVLDIVAKEGSFYELVKEPYIGKSFARPARAADLVHTLRRVHADFFIDDTSAAMSASTAQKPRPLDRNLPDYDSIPKNYSTDRQAVLRGSGYLKPVVGARIYQELLDGLKLFT